MKLKQLEEHLQAVSPAVYRDKAPEGATEYVLYHRYSSNVVIGDDSVCVAVPRVQLDIIWQTDEELPDRVKELMCNLRLPWEEMDYGYDDEWASMRCILQLELV